MKRTLAFAVLAISAVPAFAQVPLSGSRVAIVEDAGVDSGFWTRGGTGSITAEAVSWSQAAGTQFNDGVAQVKMHSTAVGVTAQGTAYLYRAAGLSGSLASATLVPTSSATPGFVNPVSFSVSTNTPTWTILFPGGVPLAAATDQTYFLLIVPAAGAAGDALAIDFRDPLAGTNYVSPTGVTLNPDRVTIAAVAAPPNTTTGFSNASPSTIQFSVGGLVGAPPVAPPTPTGVPTLGAWALLGTVALLAASALRFLRPARQS